MTVILTVVSLYALAITVLFVIVQGAYEHQTREVVEMRKERKLLRRDAARAYGRPSTFASVVDLDGRRER